MGVKITNDVSPMLEGLTQTLSKSRINKRVGVDTVQLVKQHFAKLNAERHKAQRISGFYGDCARLTQMRADDEKVEISVDKQGLRQRYYGGPIDPVRGKYLTIPARDEALGRAATEFADLTVVFGRQRSGSIGPVALAEGRKRGAKDEQGGLVMFWLVQHVQQSPDPTVIPSPEEFHAAIRASVGRLVENARRREQGASDG